MRDDIYGMSHHWIYLLRIVRVVWWLIEIWWWFLVWWVLFYDGWLLFRILVRVLYLEREYTHTHYNYYRVCGERSLIRGNHKKKSFFAWTFTLYYKKFRLPGAATAEPPECQNESASSKVVHDIYVWYSYYYILILRNLIWYVII